jgi:hypothetical protein
MDAEKQEKSEVKDAGVPRFQEGMLFPINGVWFKVEKLTKTGLQLEAVGFTKKGAAR